MSATDHAENLAANLARLVPTRQALLELAVRADVPPSHLRMMAEGTMLPCPRTLGRLATALDTIPAALLSEPPDA